VSSDSTPLLHVLSASAWSEAQQQPEYRPPSLRDEGFVHCSLVDQIVGVANRFYRGQDDLVLLVLDPDRLGAEVVFEDLYGHGGEFPHLYGPLNVDAVTEVIPFPCNDDGSFSLPPALVV
jgi:uncharacterized protein (DUF952 family)